MKTAAIVTLILSFVGVIVALFPCAGWLNWVAVPFCAVPVIIGIVGLAVDTDEETKKNPNVVLYILTIVIPCGLGIMGIVRCFIGGGLV
jgi:hypothetical protein